MLTSLTTDEFTLVLLAGCLICFFVGIGVADLQWWFRARKARRPQKCRIQEETQGLFIGRRDCSTHNIVWDDGGRCPREGQEPGQPFAKATVSQDYEGRY